MHWICSSEHPLLRPEADSIVGIYTIGHMNQRTKYLITNVFQSLNFSDMLFKKYVLYHFWHIIIYLVF